MEKINKIWSKVDKFILAIFIISLFIFATNLFGGYYYGHDTPIHLSSLEAWISSFKISDIIPSKIIPIVANDFGYGTGIFYPPLGHFLTLYIYKIISQFGFGIFLAIKCAYLLSMFLSGLFMYLFVRKVFKNNYIGLVAAAFYMTFPYHILDIFTRDAMSESYLFIFIPLIFLGIEYLFENNKSKFYLCFVGGYVGAIFSHLVLAVYMTFFVIIYLLFKYRDTFKKKNVISFLIASIFILIFSSPFILPLLEHKFFGNYAVFLPHHMYSLDGILNNTVNLGDLFYIPKNPEYTYYTIGIIPLVATITVWLCGYKKVENKKLFNCFMLCTFISLFMITKFFPWKYFPDLLLNIQFPWRIEMFLAFFMSVLGSLIIIFVKKNNQKVVATILVVISTISAIYLVNVNDYGYIDLKNINMSEVGMGWGYEYLPVKALNNFDYFENRNQDIIIKKGSAKITDVNNATPYLEFDIETDGATLELPRLYYMGYEIKLNDKKIEYYENENGFIEIKVPNDGIITMKYSGTNGYKISIILFITGVIVAIIYFYKNRKLKIKA